MMFGSARERRKAKAEKDRSSLGNILISLGYCKKSDIESVLDEPHDVPLLGQLLVRGNVITPEQLEHALLRQRALRGQVDPWELRRFGAAQRHEALNRVAGRLREIADSAGLLAQKAKG